MRLRTANNRKRRKPYVWSSTKHYLNFAFKELAYDRAYVTKQFIDRILNN